MAFVGRTIELVFEGANAQPGDRAKWVWNDPSSSDPCNSIHDATSQSEVTASADGRVSAGFSFVMADSESFKTGLVHLCYKFSYAQQEVPDRVEATPFIHFPSIKLAVIHVQHVSPRATAISCASTITIDGSGFGALAFGTDEPTAATGGSKVENGTMRKLKHAR